MVVGGAGDIIEYDIKTLELSNTPSALHKTSPV